MNHGLQSQYWAHTNAQPVHSIPTMDMMHTSAPTPNKVGERRGARGAYRGSILYWYHMVCPMLGGMVHDCKPCMSSIYQHKNDNETTPTSSYPDFENEKLFKN